jgi:hypothetical protein
MLHAHVHPAGALAHGLDIVGELDRRTSETPRLTAAEKLERDGCGISVVAAIGATRITGLRQERKEHGGDAYPQ